jgi:preprotein translocase subunit SecF
MTNYRIIQKRNLWLGISLALFIGAVIAIYAWGFKLGIDFTGGSLQELRFNSTRPTVTEIQDVLNGPKVGGLGSLVVQPVGETDMMLRFQDSTEAKHREVLKAINELAAQKVEKGKKIEGALVEEIRFDSVGPSIGQDLRQKAASSVIWVLVAIILYISYSFRKVSKPIASWKYGLAAIIALAHDAIITLGIFSWLGHYYGTEINTPFVAAILTVIGYSVHDTIVVFDRTRENLPKSSEDFEGTVNISLNQTLGRSISTSFTVLLTLLSVLIFGGESIRSFALALTVGIAIGTYSSIFVATPLLVVWENWQNKK